MSRPIMIIAGVAVLGGLSFGVYKYSQSQAQIGKGTETSAEGGSSTSMPTISVTSTEDGGTPELDKIVIKNSERPELVLEKKDDKWVITKPIAAAANQNSVKEALLNIKSWKAEKTYPLRVDDDSLKVNQLDAPHAMHIIASKGGETKTDMIFGKATEGGGVVAMLGGKNDVVYKATGYQSYRFTQDVKEWRDKEIFHFEEADVTQIAIDDKKGPFVFTKAGDKWTGSMKGAAIDHFDEEKVKTLLTALKNLNADDFGDGKTPDETGLGAPEGKITVTAKDKTFVLKVGKEAAKDPKDAASKEGRYASKDGDATVFVIAKPTAEWAMAEKDKFQKLATPDAGAGAGSDAGAAPKKPTMPMPAPTMIH